MNQPSLIDRRKLMQVTGLSAAALAGLNLAQPISIAAQSSERPTLKVGLALITESIDPHLDFRNQRGLVTYSLVEGLTARDFLTADTPGTGGTIVPSLATTWNRVDDLTLEFTLREGVLFHDGTTMTAEDVKFSLDLILTERATDYPGAKSVLGPIASVEVVDPLTIRVLTSTPDPILEKRLASYAGTIIPKAAFESIGFEGFGLQPIGTGPYKVVEYRPDDVLILESHDGYWGGPPPAARIEFRIIPEVASRIAALVSGDVDIASNIPPDQIETLESDPEVTLSGIPIANIRTIVLNTRVPVTANKRMRQALSLAIDRQLIIDTIWGGRALLPHGYQFDNWGPLYNPDRPTPAYDPDRARELITEAGYDGSTISLWLPIDTYTLADEVTAAIVEMWKAVGINAEQQNMTLADFYEDVDKKPAIQASGNDEFADPDSWYIRYGKGSAYDTYFWTPADTRFDELGEEARASLDTETRYADYQAMLDIYEDEVPSTPLYIPAEFYALRSGIKWTPYSFYYLDFGSKNLSFS